MSNDLTPDEQAPIGPLCPICDDADVISVMEWVDGEKEIWHPPYVVPTQWLWCPLCHYVDGE